MSHCFTCGNMGLADKVCPECGREPLNNSINLDRDVDVKEFVTKINDLRFV